VPARDFMPREGIPPEPPFRAGLDPHTETTMTSRRHILSAAAAGMSLPLLGLHNAFAQMPNKAARMVVPFPAGGGTDILARALAEKLRSHFPQGILVDNRAGASGRVGTTFVRTSEPDGMTMLVIPDFVMTLYPHIYPKLDYDPVRDFASVSIIARSGYALSAGPALPANVTNLEQFTAWAKANPGKAAFASTSPGAASHFIGLMLAKAIGVDLLHVPYKGGAPALQDLMAGQIPVSINPIGEVLPHIKGGRIRVLATTGKQRSQFLPDIPTMTESGLKDMAVDGWMGLFVPAKTPPKTVRDLAGWVNTALKDPGLLRNFADNAMEPTQSDPDAALAALKSNIAQWGPVVKASGFSAGE
jgi:tripartite-type tricarboxylate transporter receptor subunit TctC